MLRGGARGRDERLPEPALARPRPSPPAAPRSLSPKCIVDGVTDPTRTHTHGTHTRVPRALTVPTAQANQTPKVTTSGAVEPRPGRLAAELPPPAVTARGWYLRAPVGSQRPVTPNTASRGCPSRARLQRGCANSEGRCLGASTRPPRCPAMALPRSPKGPASFQGLAREWKRRERGAPF